MNDAGEAVGVNDAGEAVGVNDAGEVVSAAARRHRALGEPVRLRMLLLLGERPRTVGELASATAISVSAASRHLARLAGSGLVERRRRGRAVVCRLSESGSAAQRQALGAGAAVEPSSELTAMPAPPATRDPADLRDADPEEVRLCVMIGASLLRHCGPTRDAWDAAMKRQLGAGVEPCLDVLRAAALRVVRGEALDGLPLPPDLIAEGAAPFASFAFPPGTAPPDA